MPTLTAPDIDLAAMRAAILATTEPTPEPAAPEHEVRTARRVKMHEAKAWFEKGGDVLVSEHGQEETHPVGRGAVVHNNRTTTWEQLTTEVREWRHRYPNQRFYVVPTDGVAEPQPAEPKPAEWVKPTFAAPIPVLEAQAPLGDAINAALDNLYPGDSETAKGRRDKIRSAIADELSELYVYGVDLGGRVPIGEPVILGNARIEVDGYGDLVRVVCDGGAPIWDPEP